MEQRQNNKLQKLYRLIDDYTASLAQVTLQQIAAQPARSEWLNQQYSCLCKLEEKLQRYNDRMSRRKSESRNSDESDNCIDKKVYALKLNRARKQLQNLEKQVTTGTAFVKSPKDNSKFKAKYRDQTDESESNSEIIEISKKNQQDSDQSESRNFDKTDHSKYQTYNLNSRNAQQQSSDNTSDNNSRSRNFYFSQRPSLEASTPASKSIDKLKKTISAKENLLERNYRTQKNKCEQLQVQLQQKDQFIHQQACRIGELKAQLDQMRRKAQKHSKVCPLDEEEKSNRKSPLRGPSRASKQKSKASSKEQSQKDLGIYSRDLKEQIKSLQKQNADLRKKVLQLEKQLNRQKENSPSVDYVEELETDKERLEKQLLFRGKSIESLENKIKRLEEEVVELQTLNEQSKKEKQELGKELREAKQAADMYKERYFRVKNQISEDTYSVKQKSVRGAPAPRDDESNSNFYRNNNTNTSASTSNLQSNSSSNFYGACTGKNNRSSNNLLGRREMSEKQFGGLPSGREKSEDRSKKLQVLNDLKDLVKNHRIQLDTNK